ncbi:MAG: PQQ-binding-like beta-propeller repeat protein [Planctomycetaceae bacterium]|nr:PQQ-binding-like beta-propeller repeat protein [Planctomycetales bacterium]MCB9927229.1 PQQ-binding-like beta-propeller repeat protein [Planctomycetaceae bacterium]
MLRNIPRFALLLYVLAFGTLGPLRAESNWPAWRGPLGTGVSDATDLPVTWNDSNIRWKTALEGRGQSSPIVWEDKIFLTAAEGEGRERIVMGLDRATGEIRWQDVAWVGEPEPTHKMNTFASATCATDGEVVVGFFGRGGIHAYDPDGKKLWSRDLGPFEGPWGTGASPIIFQDLIIQNCDAENQASIIGLDKWTGKTVWETPRERLRGWSTPVIVQTPQRVEVVVNGELGVNAYDPTSGRELWFCKGDRGRGTPTVTRFEDLLIAVSGRPGDMFAMRTGGNGIVNDSHEVWRTKRKGGRDLPSPIVVGKYLVVVSLQPGLATCYDASTGKELDKLRLEGNFAASPISAKGLIYIPNEAGEVYVLEPGEELKVVARNSLSVSDEEIFRASITPSQQELLIRSDRVLYCVR